MRDGDGGRADDGPGQGPGGLSHLDAEGRARMVDVSGKPVTERRAVAEGFVRCAPAVLDAVRGRTLAKGDLLNTARLAGVLAAKRTDELIPLCHSLPLDHVDVELTLEEGGVRLRGVALTRSRTGVEMEALTAVAVAALTVIDMGKALDKGMVVESIRVVEKTGGRSGTYRVKGGRAEEGEGPSREGSREAPR
jgi:cyclic pyranopterin monophosphate synthase